jgi:hypothetical protein
MDLQDIAVWVTLAITILGGAITLGKQFQKIQDQQDQIDELKSDMKESKDLPIKLATLETDVKYIIQSITEIKTMLMRLE